ncbi:MAG TPA: c-type cytochrome [Anaeromyxobacteraceae bacterium]
MRTRVLFAAALVACSGARSRTPRGEPVLSFEGKVEHGPYGFGKDDLPRLPRRGFKAVAPMTGKSASFEGVAVAPILADVVEVRKDADTAIFHGRGGYAVPVPVSALRQIKPVLADKVDGIAVGEWREGAAPLQLAWPNVDQPGIESDPRARWWWVGGVTKVEMQSWVGTYGKALRVPPGASDDARLGADAISVSCIGCHRVRGVGGTRGPELKDGGARDPQAFAAMLRDHLGRTSGMDVPETSPAAARQIAAFLRALEIAGTRPEEEIQPPEPPPPLPPPVPGVRPGGY